MPDKDESEKKIKIIQIEDDADDALLIVENLKNFGLSPASLRVATATELKMALSSGDWDIVLSDYSLPHLDGHSALQIVNSHHNLPFIMVSGSVGDEAAVAIMKAGAKDFILKDDLRRLGPAVERELREVEIRRENQEKEHIIQTLIKGLAQATGLQAFDNIITGVCQWLGFEHGLIARVNNTDNFIETVSLFVDQQKAQNISQPLAGSAFDVVLGKGELTIDKDICLLFPHQQYLQDLQAQGFIGCTLNNSESEPIGILCFISKSDVSPPARMAMVLDLVAAKASSELERILAEQEKVALEEHLRQAQKMEAIGTLAGGIAHDFNNILTGIIGYSEMAQKELADLPDIHKKVSKVLQAGHRAKELVQQILTFSRHTEEEKKVCKITLIVKEAMHLLRATIPTSIEFERNIDPSCGLVRAVPSQMHQVVMNLCTNASNSMLENGGVLSVSLTNVTISDQQSFTDGLHPGDYVCLQVVDTGHGIPKESISRIFEPYYTSSAAKGGTGLGLSLVHGIVKGHHGFIDVQSTEQHGSVFKIYLPIYREKENEAEAIDSTEDFLLGGDERILVVDDEELIVQFTLEILQSCGYAVIIANDGYEALELFKQNPMGYDLIFTDMTMPKMNGLDLVLQCNAIRPEIPTILCTGYNDQVTHDLAMASGVTEFLLKPVPAGELCKVIRKCLDLSAK